MSVTLLRGLMVGAVAGFVLGGCAQLERHSSPAAVANAGQDDDAFCVANGGPQGSDAYVECRKNRDHRRGAAENRIERTHRNLSERMLSGQ
ncbi:MAG TPA: hypothetical protein VNZ94_08200 [Xanthobacteraceae bacterium]|nr:hypothetical protein [Xanthobacteraceae bacterium]